MEKEKKSGKKTLYADSERECGKRKKSAKRKKIVGSVFSKKDVNSNFAPILLPRVITKMVLWVPYLNMVYIY